MDRKLSLPLPADTYILDNVARFVVSASLPSADSVAAAEEGCRQVKIGYEVLPAVFDPEEAMRSGAPAVHDKDTDPFIRQPQKNILIDVHGHAATSRPVSLPPTTSTRPPTSARPSSTLTSKRTAQ